MIDLERIATDEAYFWDNAIDLANTIHCYASPLIVDYSRLRLEYTHADAIKRLHTTMYQKKDFNEKLEVKP